MELTLDQALQKGVEAHKAGQVQEADRLYTAILQAQPKHPDANHNMGVLAVGVGKVQEALPFFKSALEANPGTAQFWLSYIDALIKLERLADAKAVFDQAKGNDAKGEGFDKLEQRLNIANKEHTQDNAVTKTLETNQSSTLNIAVQLRETGEFDQAIGLLKDEINHFPEDADMLALLSHCYLLADQVEEAKLYLDNAKKIAPDNASVGWNTARIKLKEKNPLEALNVARDTSQRFPGNVEGMGVLGACLRANNEIIESLKVLNRAIELNPDYAEALINRGLIRLSQENKPEALADLELAHGLKPHIKQIWDLVVNLKMEAQEYSDAIVLLINMVEIDPEDEKRLATLALCYQHLKDFEASEEAYNKAIALKPDYAEAFNNMGNVLKEQGKLEEAVETYNKALAVKPDYPDAYYNMGAALQEQGKLEEAIGAYNKALAIKPDYAKACNNMGATLQDQGKLEEAIEAYNKALTIKPDYAEAYYGLAASLYEQGDLPGVITNLQHVNSNTSEHNSEHSFRRLPYKILATLRSIEADTIKSSIIGKNLNKFPLKIKRAVEPELIKCLYELSTQSLNDTKDARYGAGKCSPDFKLFESEQPIIKKVSSNLLKLMEDALGAQILYHESFFNILGAGGGSKPHNHIKLQDRHFGLDKYKYSLVYYLSVGDQNCTEPGILKLYDPDIDILPTKGMGILIPAIRKHSAVYNGLKDRIMIGCNFYAL